MVGETVAYDERVVPATRRRRCRGRVAVMRFVVGVEQRRVGRLPLDLLEPAGQRVQVEHARDEPVV